MIGKKHLYYARLNLKSFSDSGEFADHFQESSHLIDPEYEGDSVPDYQEDLNGAFRHLTANLSPELVAAFKDLVTAAFILGKRTGMSASLDNRGSVWIDEDPTRPQWCRGAYRERVLRSLRSVEDLCAEKGREK